MFRQAIIATAVATSVLAAPAAFAYTIGYVDTAKVLTSYKGAQSAQAQMQKELQAYQTQLADRQKKIQEAQKAGKSQAELQKMMEQFEKELAPLKNKAAQLEQKLSADVKTKVEAQIKSIAQRRKVDVVIDKAAVLYGGVDLTNDVINALK
ncbi:MAG: OmpH family outer membrane protein [Candidatus Sericytochromatia bacterium]